MFKQSLNTIIEPASSVSPSDLDITKLATGFS